MTALVCITVVAVVNAGLAAGVLWMAGRERVAAREEVFRLADKATEERRELLTRIQRPEMVPVKRNPADAEMLKAAAVREAEMRKAFSQVGTVSHLKPDQSA